jgi:hypothetical protein
MSPIVTLPKGGLAGAMYQWVRGYPAKEKRNTEGFDTLDLKEAKALLRKGQFVVKYFLLRKATRSDSRLGQGSKRAKRSRLARRSSTCRQA